MRSNINVHKPRGLPKVLETTHISTDLYKYMCNRQWSLKVQHKSLKCYNSSYT